MASELKHAKYISDLDVPPYLYKFRTWEDENHKKMLSDQEVWFASPSKFNDPFDGKVPLRRDLLSNDEKIKYMDRMLRDFEPGLGEEERRTISAQEVNTNPVFRSDPCDRSKANKELSDRLDDNYGILSFAGVYESILLWSHYAASHAGFCIEIDARKLADQLFDLFSTDKHNIFFRKVKYRDELPDIVPSDDPDMEYDVFLDLLSVKSSQWCYEREYRFIWSGKTEFKQSISRDVITRVFLGCRMSPEHREELVETVRTQLPKTQIWTAQRSLDRFALTFEQLK